MILLISVLLLYFNSFDIVTQIMQATTLQNVKRARGIDVDVVEKGSNVHNISRQQIAEAKKLKRYISQLSIAKAECETALRNLGWDGAFPTVESDNKVPNNSFSDLVIWHVNLFPPDV